MELEKTMATEKSTAPVCTWNNNFNNDFKKDDLGREVTALYVY